MQHRRSSHGGFRTLSFFDPKCGGGNKDGGGPSRRSAVEITFWEFNSKYNYGIPSRNPVFGINTQSESRRRRLGHGGVALRHFKSWQQRRTSRRRRFKSWKQRDAVRRDGVALNLESVAGTAAAAAATTTTTTATTTTTTATPSWLVGRRGYDVPPATYDVRAGRPGPRTPPAPVGAKNDFSVRANARSAR